MSGVVPVPVSRAPARLADQFEWHETSKGPVILLPYRLFFPLGSTLDILAKRESERVMKEDPHR